MSITGNNTTTTPTASRTVMSRIALKIDTWKNWQEEAAQNLVLHAGEVAFVQVGTVPPISYSDDTKGTLTQDIHLNKEPNQVLFKVGDGVTPFKDLVWGSAKAADVYDWAKVSSANIVEISCGSGSTEKKSTLSEFLQAFETYKTSNDQAITNINNSITALTEATTDTSKNDSLASRLAVVEGLAGIGGDEGSTESLATVGYVDGVKEDLIGESNAQGVVSTIKEASAQAIAAQSTADEAKTWINNNKTNLEKVSADPITSTEVATAISNHNTNVKHITESEMNTAISNADNTLESKLKGTSTSNTVATTIAGASDKAEAAQTTANQANTVAVRAEDKVDTLIGTETIEIDDPDNEGQKKSVLKDAGKSVRTIANEELAAQLIPTNAKEALNTLQEIASWIQAHPEDASEFNRVLANLGTRDGQSTTRTVKEYVDDAIGVEATARATAITTAIQGLDMTKVEVGAGETIKEISETDGVVNVTTQAISITKSQIPDFAHNHDNDYAEKTATEQHIANGDIHVTKTQKDSWDAAAPKAESAIQGVKVNGTELTPDSNKNVDVKIETGSANGNIKVNGTDVAVKGLGTAAYTDATAYASSTDFSTHLTKAVTTETYLLIDCGTSTINVD